jgi:hypothetical protein
MNSSSELPNKKAYHTPKLSKYGDLAEMTTATAMVTGSMDAMTGSTKTAV